MGKVAYSTLKTMKSIITDDLEHCYECGNRAEDCHHVFEGADKRSSEYFKLMIPMCHKCHMDLHNNQNMNNCYKKIGQLAFIEKHPDKRWLDYFRKNYI